MSQENEYNDQFDQEQLIAQIEEKRKKIYHYIEKYFQQKKLLIDNYKHIPIEKIFSNAPSYYHLIRIIEQINSFLSNDPKWLQKYVLKNNYSFDFDNYKRWKAGKHYKNQKYDETKCPAKWVHLLQDMFIELLKAIQLLLYLEFYIPDEQFKKFLKENAHVELKRKKNYMRESPPSENLQAFFQIIDFILNKNIEMDFTTCLVINTVDCLQTYREIDKLEIFKLLKRKRFFIQYRLEYLRKMPKNERLAIPYEREIIVVCEEFLQLSNDINYHYNEYKTKLLEKYNKVQWKLNK